MLRQLSIRDVVLIDRLELEFEPGLGVLTGETGAGKSILLDSLGLALGVRADTGLVRSGQPQASVAAEFELPPDHPAFALLADQGVEREPGEPLLVRRTLKADGGSRAFAGARVCRRRCSATSPTAWSRSTASMTIAACSIRAATAPCSTCSAGLKLGLSLKAGARWSGWSRLWPRRDRRRKPPSAIATGSNTPPRKLMALAPVPGEETSLSEQRAAMQAGAKAGEALTGLDELLGGSEGALAQLRAAARRIERGAADHPLLAEALASLDRALIEASEAEDRIARAAEALAFDPANSRASRRGCSTSAGLARKHRVEADALAALGDELHAKLALIEAGGERIARWKPSWARLAHAMTRRRGVERGTDRGGRAARPAVAEELHRSSSTLRVSARPLSAPNPGRPASTGSNLKCRPTPARHSAR